MDMKWRKILPNKDALHLGIWYILVWPYNYFELERKQEFYFFNRNFVWLTLFQVMTELSDGEDFFLIDYFLKQF